MSRIRLILVFKAICQMLFFLDVPANIGSWPSIHPKKSLISWHFLLLREFNLNVRDIDFFSANTDNRQLPALHGRYQKHDQQFDMYVDGQKGWDGAKISDLEFHSSNKISCVALIKSYECTNLLLHHSLNLHYELNPLRHKHQHNINISNIPLQLQFDMTSPDLSSI